MAHFAEIKNNKVVRVIVVSNDDIVGMEEPISIEGAKKIPILKLLGGEWVQTSHNNSFRGIYAAIGDKWDGKNFSRNLPDYTPPTLSTLRVAIPQAWEMLFPNDRFIVGGFDIALERTEANVLCVDIAYLEWKAFQNELDKPENAALKRHMEVVWDYLKNEIEQHNFV